MGVFQYWEDVIDGFLRKENREIGAITWSATTLQCLGTNEDSKRVLVLQTYRWHKKQIFRIQLFDASKRVWDVIDEWEMDVEDYLKLHQCFYSHLMELTKENRWEEL